MRGSRVPASLEQGPGHGVGARLWSSCLRPAGLWSSPCLWGLCTQSSLVLEPGHGNLGTISIDYSFLVLDPSWGLTWGAPHPPHPMGKKDVGEEGLRSPCTLCPHVHTELPRGPAPVPLHHLHSGLRSLLLRSGHRLSHPPSLQVRGPGDLILTPCSVPK